MRMDAPVEHRYAPNLWAIVAEGDLAQPFEYTGYVPPRVDGHLEQADIVDGFHPRGGLPRGTFKSISLTASPQPLPKAT